MADYRTTHKRLYMEHTLLRQTAHPRTWMELLRDVNALMEEQGLKHIGISSLKADIRRFQEQYPGRDDLFISTRQGGEKYGERLLAYTHADEPFPFGDEPEQPFADRVRELGRQNPDSPVCDWLVQLVQAIENGTQNMNAEPLIYYPNDNQ